MNKMIQSLPKRPPAATMIASVFVLAGFLLAGIDWGFLAVSAVAMFLPGILREMGWLKDKDEFQLQAARRAGYHAYMAGGLFAFLLTAWYRSVGPEVGFPGALVEDVLVVMWFTWLLSSLVAYWGAARTATRLLLIFGGVWLLFNLLGSGGKLVETLIQCLLAVPFFLTALVARRWPRVAGVLLLGFSVFFFKFFGLAEVFAGDPSAHGRILVIVLFIGPLFASGVALLSLGQEAKAAA